jgi:DNA-binding cell septation regulator SpoVG
MEVLNIRKVGGHKHLLGIATISLYGKVEITGFAILRQDNGMMTTGWPQVSWIRDGKVYQQLLLKLPTDLKKLIRQEILKAWEKERSTESERKVN